MSLLLRVAFLSLFLTGCGGAMAPQSSPAARKEAAAGAEQAPQGGEPKDAPIERKLIYRGFLDVVVKDLDEALPKFEAALAAHKAYVAKSDQRGDAYPRRYATFTIRVPVAAFRPLVADLKALGTAERDAIESDDVTEEYRDIQTQVKNLKAEEETLNRLMREKAASVEDVLKIRQQIQPVRERIDRAEGRFEYLSKMTALSTVNLTLREIKDYKPQPATFGEKAGRSFSDSTSALVDFGQAIALGVVALVPWLPLIVPAAVVLVVWARRRLRELKSTRTPPPAEVIADPPPAAP
jgi:hypothetical protein